MSEDYRKEADGICEDTDRERQTSMAAKGGHLFRGDGSNGRGSATGEHEESLDPGVCE